MPWPTLKPVRESAAACASRLRSHGGQARRFLRLEPGCDRRGELGLTVEDARSVHRNRTDNGNLPGGGRDRAHRGGGRCCHRGRGDGSISTKTTPERGPRRLRGTAAHRRVTASMASFRASWQPCLKPSIREAVSSGVVGALCGVRLSVNSTEGSTNGDPDRMGVPGCR